jgi:hypothetical protein
MIKLLSFEGPCSFATFLSTAGESIVSAVRLVRCFDGGGVICFLDLEPLDDSMRCSVGTAIQVAHAVEPVKLDHDVKMTPAVLAFIVDRLGKNGIT